MKNTFLGTAAIRTRGRGSFVFALACSCILILVGPLAGHCQQCDPNPVWVVDPQVFPTNRVLTLCNGTGSMDPNIEDTAGSCSSEGTIQWTLKNITWTWTSGTGWVKSGSNPDCDLWLFYDTLSGHTIGVINRSDDAPEEDVTVTATCFEEWTIWTCQNVLISSNYNTFPLNFTWHISNGDCGCSGNNGATTASAPAHKTPLGTCTVNNDRGPDLKFALGEYSAPQDAGTLALSGRTTTASLSSPAALYMAHTGTGGATNVDVVTSSGVIQQVKSPQGLLNINVVNSSKYQLQMFDNSCVVGKVGGVYLTNGSGAAFEIWTIDGSTSTNLLTVTDNRSGLASRSFTYLFTNISGINTCQLTDSGNLRTVLSWQIQNPTNSSMYSAFQQTLSGSTTVQMTEHDFILVGTIPKLTTQIDGVGSITNITAYTHDSYQNVQEIDYPDGNWIYYQYDNLERVSYKYEAYNNCASPASLGYVDTSNCKQTIYDYTAAYASDDRANNLPGVARKEAVYLPVGGGSVQTSVIYRSCPAPDEIEEWHCPNPTATWGDPANTLTTTVLNMNAADVNTFGTVNWQVQADGTATLYNYQENGAGAVTNLVVQTGQPDNAGNPSSIVNGTQTSTAYNTWGQPLSITTQYISNSVVCTVLDKQTYTYTDNMQQSCNVVDLANRTNQFQYACCGLSSVTDPDGVITLFSYDTLRRQVAMTTMRGGSSGVTVTNIVDPVGRNLVTQRIGTDGTKVTLNQSLYDVLGRVIRQTNALSGVTVTTNVMSGNQLIVTNTYPDGGISVSTYYADGTLQSRVGSAVFPRQYIHGAEQDPNLVYWQFDLEVKLSASGGTNEWVKTYFDGAGNTYEVFHPKPTGTSVATSYYNNSGQLTNQLDPDGVSMLYAFNPKGEQAYSVLDLNQDYNIDFTGSDRITFTTNDVVSDHGTAVQRTQVYVWNTNSVGTSTLISTTETSTNGLWTWNTAWNNGSGLLRQSWLVFAGGGNRYLTNIAPDNSYTVSAFQYGLMASTTRYDVNRNQIAKTTYGYDAHFRQNSSTDARNGTTTYTFNNADQVTGTITPPPTQMTTVYFDNMGRTVGTTLPDGTSVTNFYDPTSLLELTYGSRVYPAGYSYDAQGRIATMTNWSNFSSLGGKRVTTWNYDIYRGFLANKVYDGNTAGPSYTYSGAGRLLTRLWARGTNTTHSYNPAGDWAGTTYNDAVTPALSFGYDRRGRLNAITNGTSVCALILNDAGNLMSEAYSGTGPLSGISITNGYDGLLRRTNNVTLSGSTILTLITNSWDAASRLLTVSDGTNSATYSYLANSPLVSQIQFTNGGSLRMTTTKNYDNLNRPINISTVNMQPLTLDSHGYIYNNANQRERNTFADGSSWLYIYDALGQVVSGHRFFADQTPVAGQLFDYSFDTIGNRTQTMAGGDQNGLNQRVATYGANNLNQYTNRSVPGFADIMGLSLATNTVTVGGQTAYRKSEYFRDQLSVNNGSAVVWTNLAVVATGQNSVTGNVYVAQTPETYGYDADGNLTSDGRWTYTWDGENRLVSMQGLSGIPTGAKLKLDFVYDYLGRRIQKMVSTNNGSGYFAQSTNRFVYDRWNLLAILNPQTSVLQSFVWGLDMSGTSQGAGGVGGLLEVRDLTNGTCFSTCDGNGNVTLLLKATDATISANYEYGPFGEAIRVTGPLARNNPLRFSTKYQDDETDLLYYGYRYLNASTGRWLSRDPAQENGVLNLYVAAGNDLIRSYDRLGLLPGPGYVRCTPLWPITAMTPWVPFRAEPHDEWASVEGATLSSGATIIYKHMVTQTWTCTCFCGGTSTKTATIPYYSEASGEAGAPIQWYNWVPLPMTIDPLEFIFEHGIEKLVEAIPQPGADADLLQKIVDANYPRATALGTPDPKDIPKKWCLWK
jgi:RHS repeat-associated protein